MPKDHIQEIPTEWTDAPKLVDHNGVELVCRVVGSDGRGMFTDFLCFKAVNRDAGEGSLDSCMLGLRDGGGADVKVGGTWEHGVSLKLIWTYLS